jgi:hypothetical protein
MRDVLDQALRCADEFAARTTAAVAAIDAGKLYWRTQSARKRHPSGWIARSSLFALSRGGHAAPKFSADAWDGNENRAAISALISLRFSENGAIVRLVMMTSSIDGASVGRRRPQVSTVGRRGSGRKKWPGLAINS